MKKIALVTGANSGMGKATVAALADRSIHVVMLCRSEQRGKQALADIQTNARSIDLMICDLSSMQSIRTFTESFKQKYDRLDILVNNAGVITLGRHETADNLELQFGVNHIGHFLLTLLLLDLLNNTPSSRIFVVGSGAYNAGRIYFDDINLSKHYNVVRSYSQSKLSNLLFARELAVRLKKCGSGVTVNVAHPGAVGTQMGVDRQTGFGKTIMKVLSKIFLTPEEGSQTAVFLATDDSVSKTSGEYFYKSKIKPTSKRGRDMKAAKRLFELSESISGITFDEVMPCNSTI